MKESYDRVAADYAELLRDELADKPLDRAMLAVFAEQVGQGRVADLGCGPGRITAHLQSLGVQAFGVDQSSGMIAVARRTHPGLVFSEGDMAALDLPEGGLAGIVAWYSLIHTPTEQVPVILGEFARVLGPRGVVLLAFQVGDDVLHLDQAYGHPVSIDVYRRTPELVAEMLAAAGLPVRVKVVREPEGRERSPQAYLIAGRN